MNAIDKTKFFIGLCTKNSGSHEFEVLTRATEIVDLTIIGALKGIEKRDDCANGIDRPGCEKKNLFRDGQTEWPTAEKMSVRAGLTSVKEMMMKWKTQRAMRRWEFCAEFIGLDSDSSSDFYNYQVRWSVPTAAYPEPQVTVSVFFTIQASRMKNPSYPVDVTYVFEGHEFVHNSTLPFRPQWIYDVLDTKTMIFKSFTF